MSETKMDLELQLLGDVSVTRLIDRPRLAEANNYSAVWVSDERFYRDVYMCLAQIASNTSHVRVGTSVTDPYVRHPALTAVAMATLDEISGGRAVLGIGAGISGFAELQIERRKPARAMREAITVIRSLLKDETVDFQGDVIILSHGRLSFRAGRVVPVYVASNGVMGQRMAAEVADGIIVNACASVAEVRALRAAVDETARRVGRDPKEVKIAARLNACVSTDGQTARDAVRPSVARYLGTPVHLRTFGSQGLALPTEAVAQFAGTPYSAGTKPYMPLLPLVTDRHVDALTLAGTVDEVAAHGISLRDAGVDAIIARPTAPNPDMNDETIHRLGAEVWPRVQSR
jgi:5,10-methylenetetrahydromethanopterin reductase